MHYITVSLRSQMQYRASFLMLALGHFVVTGVEVLGIWVLFERFGAVRGWRLPEVALLYGLVNTAFALAEAFGRGFDVFPRMVKSGAFDRMLLRPRATALQVMASEVQAMRVGRLTQGLIVLLWAAHRLDVDWTAARVMFTLVTIGGGMFLFCGLFVLQATAAFWTVDSLEVFNTVTYGGTETAQYPLHIYRPWFRRFFTYVVPLAAVAYYPATVIMGRVDDPGTLTWRLLSPLIGYCFFAACLLIWRSGVRHYRSTGS
ncbi:MAG: ABC transporter permease [Chitinivibrionales bacterium]|nr:ABC transporter permease [Chitinivibrionales bacterium]